MKLPCKGERKTRVLSQREKTTIMETSLILPKFNQPTNLDKAAFLINQLGKNIHEHAYLVGKILKWVKEEGVNHGEFISWVEKNVWFDRTTATRYMKFTEQCDKKGILIEYSPRFQMLHRATNENLETSIPPKKVFIIFEDDANRFDNNRYYGNYIDELEQHIYKRNWIFQGKEHITFKYPEAFIKIKL